MPISFEGRTETATGANKCRDPRKATSTGRVVGDDQEEKTWVDAFPSHNYQLEARKSELSAGSTAPAGMLLRAPLGHLS